MYHVSRCCCIGFPDLQNFFVCGNSHLMGTCESLQCRDIALLRLCYYALLSIPTFYRGFWEFQFLWLNCAMVKKARPSQQVYCQRKASTCGVRTNENLRRRDAIAGSSKDLRVARRPDPSANCLPFIQGHSVFKYHTDSSLTIPFRFPYLFISIFTLRLFCLQLSLINAQII